MTLCVRVRRLRCGNQRCIRRIFAERAEGLISAHARRTARLFGVQRCVGLALGGEAGARLVDRLGMPVSPDTLLRMVRNRPPAKHTPPRILGVDDWAWRRGQRYGTVLIDLETNRLVDLLPDRDASTLARWLQSHPGIEIIARDRAGAYAQGARQGAPAASQIAVRWRLLRNCSATLLDVVERRHRQVRDIGRVIAAGKTEAADPFAPRPVPTAASRAARQLTAGQAHRMALFHTVTELRQKGWSTSAILRETGLDRKTVSKWLKDKRPGSWMRRKLTGHPADVFEIYLRGRWDEGCRNASQLYREVSSEGYQGSARGLRNWVRTRLRQAVSAPVPPRPSPRTGWGPPSSRHAAWLLTAPAEMMARPEKGFVEALRAAAPAIAIAADLATRFHTMLTARDADALDPWLEAALDSPLAPFARGLKRDIDAVRAALLLPWSAGPVEGKINKLKLIKRSMYGRAGLDLLRERLMA